MSDARYFDNRRECLIAPREAGEQIYSADVCGRRIWGIAETLHKFRIGVAANVQCYTGETLHRELIDELSQSQSNSRPVEDSVESDDDFGLEADYF